MSVVWERKRGGEVNFPTFALHSWAELALVEAEVLVGVTSVGILIYLTPPEWPVKELLCEQV